jgi:hypothetical protein
MDSNNYAAMASHDYRFELTLTRGPEQEILDQQEFGVHLTVKNSAGSDSEEDRSVSDHDTHADHDAHAGLRAELEFDQRERAIADDDYAAEQESCQPQSDSPPHASIVEHNFALTEEEEEWVQDHAEYAHSDCEEDFCEEFEDFALTEEEDDWVSGL